MTAVTTFGCEKFGGLTGLFLGCLYCQKQLKMKILIKKWYNSCSKRCGQRMLHLKTYLSRLNMKQNTKDLSVSNIF